MSFKKFNIKSIVFDLDGTLYTCKPFADLIQKAAVDYMAELLNKGFDETDELMKERRKALQNERGTSQTLSAVCIALGGTLQGMHEYFKSHLNPESYLLRDERVVDFLERLSKNYSLYILTNNNRELATRIVSYLGFLQHIQKIYAIDDNWRGKPDEETVDAIISEVGGNALEILFVGDRYDIDLRVPESKSAPVYLVEDVATLLKLEELLAL